jgi:hypothetical protein
MFGPHADPSRSSEAQKVWLDIYNNHNAEIWAHFNGKQNFLVMELAKDDGWEKLCSFLEEPIPQQLFPVLNRTKK